MMSGKLDSLSPYFIVSISMRENLLQSVSLRAPVRHLGSQ